MKPHAGEIESKEIIVFFQSKRMVIITAQLKSNVVVFSIVDFHMIGALLYSMTMQDVYVRDALLSQSVSASGQ